jgi:hypothetical protein
MRFVDRRRHGDDDEIGLRQRRAVGGARQVRRGAELSRQDLAGRVLEAAIRGDLAFREIQTDRRTALAEFNREWKSHVPQADDGDDWQATDHVLWSGGVRRRCSILSIAF